MEQNISEMPETILKLPVEARAFLAGSLLGSLDERVDIDAEAAWEAEVIRRVEELDTGVVQPVSWADARRDIFGR
jgi:putative addiction module component (TIGR02574 family)